jgi:hypothetical protein
MQATNPGDEQWRILAEGMIAVSPDAAADQIRDELIRLITTEQAQHLPSLASDLGEALGDRIHTVAAKLREEASNDPSAQTEALLTASAAMAGNMDDEEAAAALEMIRHLILGPHGPHVLGALHAESSSALLSRIGGELRASLIDDLKSATADPERLSAIRYLLDSWTALTKKQHRALRTIIVKWIRERLDLASEISTAIQPYPAGADDREPVVRAFLYVAREASEWSWRTSGLVAASQIAKSTTEIRLCEEAIGHFEQAGAYEASAGAEQARAALTA